MVDYPETGFLSEQGSLNMRFESKQIVYQKKKKKS